MLRQQPFFTLSDGINYELMQAKAEGKDIEGLKKEVEEVLAIEGNNSIKQQKAIGIFDKIQSMPIKKTYTYVEPSTLEEIRKERPQAHLQNDKLPEDTVLYNKIYGAWLGRCSGCLLGKPVEFWLRERLVGLAKETSNYPLNSYISSNISDELRKKYEIIDHTPVSFYGTNVVAWINNVQNMPEDDDLNYTTLNLKILEDYGLSFTSDDVAECWLDNLPILHVFTAERIAYRNLSNAIFPPYSANYCNAYREMIGAQIRADIFGYVNPGDTILAAEFAFRDASISHTKNGIYGEMFVAAMLAAAAVTDNIEIIIEAGLSEIPARSRLTEKIREVLSWKKENISWETAIDRIHSYFDEKNLFDWCNTISNAMIVCTSLLFGEKNFSKSISISVLAGFDTDCNGATVGSILGMVLGADNLPTNWIAPLEDKLQSGIAGFGMVSISDLAKRSLDIVKKSREVCSS